VPLYCVWCVKPIVSETSSVGIRGHVTATLSLVTRGLVKQYSRETLSLSSIDVQVTCGEGSLGHCCTVTLLADPMCLKELRCQTALRIYTTRKRLSQCKMQNVRPRDEDDSSTGRAQEAGPSKRGRIARQACEPCRSGKRKCDGAHVSRRLRNNVMPVLTATALLLLHQLGKRYIFRTSMLIFKTVSLLNTLDDKIAIGQRLSLARKQES
jgi:hypothetical protein